MRLRWIVILMLCISLCASALDSFVRPIFYPGEPSGGILRFGILARGYLPEQVNVVDYVSVLTCKSDTKASIARKLADGLTEAGFLDRVIPVVDQRPDYFDLPDRERVLTGPDKDTLLLEAGMRPGYMSSGTESGLGILPPPYSMTVQVESGTRGAVLYWQDISTSSRETEALVNNIPVSSFPDSVAAETGRWKVVLPELCRDATVQTWFLFSYARGTEEQPQRLVPSNAVAMTLLSGGQEELYDIPFYLSIAPNWRQWNAGQNHKVTYAEGVRNTDAPKRVTVDHPDQKVFYQIISSSERDAVGGVFRHFLGLASRRKYRVSVRVSTLDNGKSKEDSAGSETWSYSIHVTPNTMPSVDGLKPEQFAGAASLPDGTCGPDAGKIACFGPDSLTDGNWVVVRTGDAGAVRDIDTGDRFDSITVWLRVSGEVPKGVGMDWIRLEEVVDSKN